MKQLYEKYRPRSWPEVVGQDKVIFSLTPLLCNSNIPILWLNINTYQSAHNSVNGQLLEIEKAHQKAEKLSGLLNVNVVMRGCYLARDFVVGTHNHAKNVALFLYAAMKTQTGEVVVVNTKTLAIGYCTTVIIPMQTRMVGFMSMFISCQTILGDRYVKANVSIIKMGIGLITTCQILSFGCVKTPQASELKIKSLGLLIFFLSTLQKSLNKRMSGCARTIETISERFCKLSKRA